MEHHIPEEILFQILIRLPVLSLLRFRCVSKFWYALISSFDFIESHLNHNQYQLDDNKDALITKTNCLTESYSLHADNDQLLLLRRYMAPYQNLSILGCVNGLICLAQTANLICLSNTLVLWNPAIRKTLFLPRFNGHPTLDHIGSSSSSTQKIVEANIINDFNFGFGYDVLTNDFKVIRMIVYRIKFNNGNDSPRGFATVYSLATRMWKPLKACPSMHLISRACTLDNFVYRLALMPKYKTKILCFDLGDETFVELDLPKADKEIFAIKTELATYRGCLGLLNKLDIMIYDFWVYGGEGVAKSWMKICTIPLEQPGHCIAGFTMRGQMVVADDYALGSKEAELDMMPDVPTRNHICCQQAWRVDSFKESLFLLNEDLDLDVDLHL